MKYISRVKEISHGFLRGVNKLSVDGRHIFAAGSVKWYRVRE